MTQTAHNFSHGAGTRTADKLPHSCRCGARWSGYNTAHCAAQCHQTFSGETTFRRHRSDGRCVPPRDLGMSPVPGRAYECWGYPGEVAE